ncbi:hypothetical protein [Marinobacter fonticola]|uniref:hypothetical protein n=1 Tax=Marinobacter fonticola TaxID=2603215 RepID=UPI0011E709AE|nr:hypothetical protein [Marinobacter fonticola]
MTHIFAAGILAAMLFALPKADALAAELNQFEPVEPRAETPTITINATAHPIRLPLQSLANTLFLGDNGEIINYTPTKGIYASVVTPDEWGNPSIPLGKLPEYIFEEDTAAVGDAELKEDIRGISRIVLEPRDEKKIGKMVLGDTTVYIAYSLSKTNLMLVSPDKPNLYSHIVVDGFTWDEIVDDILKGIGSK